MLTYKLKIETISDEKLVDKMCQEYSYAFRKLYVNYDKIKNKSFIKELCKKYHLDSWLFESLKTEVETKISQTNTIKANKLEKQKEIETELEKLKDKTSKKDKRTKYKLMKKLKSLLSFKDIVFGTKELLKRISFLSNDKESNEKELEKAKLEFKDNRLLSIFIGGETYHNGNRKCDFDFKNKKLVVKPKKGTEIDIEFICSKKQHKQLSKLQDLIDKNNVLPITIRLSTDYIWIMFDEEILSGYHIVEKDRKKELKKIPKEDKILRKEVYKKFFADQRDRKLTRKFSFRYLAVDLNPQYIGWCICDFIDNKIRIIAKGCYDLTELSKHLKLSSDHPDQIAQNNKRKHEICNIWKDLFEKVTHYKVAHFVMEDLNFKDKVVNEESKEFNRKVRNIWHRGLTCQLITKYCNILGIQKIEVNPVYSSFIGNIQYKYFDPTNASLEICRRGIFKFVKGSFLPRLTEVDFDTMSRLVLGSRDVQNKTELVQKVRSCTKWKDLFYLFKQTEVKYRRYLDDLKESFKEFSLFSYRSKVILYEF